MMNLLHVPPGRRLPLEFSLPGAAAGTPVQGAFDELGPALHEATFVVVDLETTGGSPTTDRITEIGAVKVRGGEVLGEFATLVDPGVAIPPQITVLTGITTAMVIGAPRIEEVLPTFLEFAHGCIFVAHNARFDLGFLRAATSAHQLPWAPLGQVDTLALARRVVTKDEAPNHKLASLARVFGSPVTPDHRALSDARATVAVFHGLLERLGSLGVTHVDDLATATAAVPAARRRKVALVADAPTTPGVYLFKGPNAEVLYVGTAKNLRRRLRGYFTSAPDRKRIGEMVDLAARVDIVSCPTVIEARVRELRLIAEHNPPYNRRSKRPDSRPWLRLTNEPLPRFAIVRSLPPDAIGLGPFSSRKQAVAAQEALTELGVRACTTRLPRRVSPTAVACALAQLDRCSAPCIDQAAAAAYDRIVADVRSILGEDARELYLRLLERMSALAAEERFEDAARTRDRLTSLLTALHRFQRLSPWWSSPEITAARWCTDGPGPPRWEVIVVRHGRLAASGVCPPGQDPLAFFTKVARLAAYVPPPTRIGGAATPEETELLAQWCERPGVRLISHEGPPLAWPLNGGQALLQDLSRRAGGTT